MNIAKVIQQSITISAVVHVYQQTKEEDGNIHRNMDMKGVAEVNWLT